MSNFIYNTGKGIISDWAGLDIRVLLLSGVAGEDKDHEFLDDALAPGGMVELSDGSYARQALGGEALNLDNPNDRQEADANDAVFPTLAGGETINGYIVFSFVTNDALSTPIAFVDSATGIGLVTNGSNVTITWNAEGIIQITDA